MGYFFRFLTILNNKYYEIQNFIFGIGFRVVDEWLQQGFFGFQAQRTIE